MLQMQPRILSADYTVAPEAGAFQNRSGCVDRVQIADDPPAIQRNPRKCRWTA